MHVSSGRSEVNYQEWDKPQEEADESAEEVQERSMPPAYFTLFGLHADANFTDAERADLIAGLKATFGDEEDEDDDEDEDEDDDDDEDDD